MMLNLIHRRHGACLPPALVFLVLLIESCSFRYDAKTGDELKHKVIFDTDANNELDDQHALAYLLFNGKTFDVLGVTVNATSSGGNIDNHYEEAKRIMQLSGVDGKIPLLKGANGSFREIETAITEKSFDGSEAVDFIIGAANKNEGLILMAVGKLTNVALAVKKDPKIISKIRLVWLGSNYPLPGEYNQDNDTVSMNYLLNSEIPFEMVTVRYGKPSGTDAVKVTQQEIEEKMPGLGPVSKTPVQGRHEGTFTTFGDYSVNLFKHIDYYSPMKTRALFDMVAVAVVKNPSWGQQKEIPAPLLVNNEWVERPANARKIIVWENFDKEKILEDFFAVMKNYELIE